MTDPLLRIDGLAVTAGGRRLVDGLDLEMGPGARVGLIGESGSGKSLTTLAILGLLPEGLRATGSISLDGREVVGASERDLVRLRGRAAAPVFQDPRTALDPLMRVGRQISEPLRRRGLSGVARREAMRSLLDQVALGSDRRIERAFPHELSGGQRQRIALAMALANDPLLLIADEPTTALDVSVQAEMLDLVDRVAADRGTAVLFVSHDLAVVRRIVRDAVVLHRGRAVERGPVERLLAAPDDPYTASLVSSARRLERAFDERKRR